MCEGAAGNAANVEETRKSTIKLFGTTISVSHCACKRRPAPASEAFAENDSHRRTKISKNTEDMTEICCNSLEINTSLKPAIATVKSEEKPKPRPENSLTCPRCESIDTKFCYFNNYKVNQPRHFCRNCRRYWTAGGTLRDVPASAARRKSKDSSEFQLRNASLAVDLQLRKPELHNLTESLQQTLVFSAGVETKDSSCLEEINKPELHNLTESLQQTLIFSAGVEKKDSSWLEEMHGGKSFGFEGTVLW